MDQSKVQVPLDCPIPLNLKIVGGFLVLTGYNRRFIKSYASLRKKISTAIIILPQPL